MQQVRALVRTAARTDAPVLIEGETGTGKEVVARAIHALGRARARPFVPVNCAAVPETLAESEFFGHARGAFTGARRGAAGRAPPGRRRHALPRRDRGPAAVAAGEAAARGPGRRGAAARRQRGAPGRRRGSSPRRTASSGAWSRRAPSGATSSTACASSPSGCRRCASARDDLPLLVAHFVAAFNRRHGTRFAVAAARAAAARCSSIPGPATCASSRTRSSRCSSCAGAEQRDLADVLRRAPAVDGGFWPDERARILRVLERPSLEPAARRRRARHLARHAVASHGAPRHPRSARRRVARNVLSVRAATSTRAARAPMRRPTCAARRAACCIAARPPAPIEEVSCRSRQEAGDRRRRSRRGSRVLALRAVTVHSVGSAPLIYRVTTNNNDLDSVEGLAPPGALVELWYKQRNFREGTTAGADPFSWCAWKNNGSPDLPRRGVGGRERQVAAREPAPGAPRSCSFRPPPATTPVRAACSRSCCRARATGPGRDCTRLDAARRCTGST